MNPFSYYLSELEQDGSDDTVSMSFRYVLPAWATAWTASPTSYQSVFDAIFTAVKTLPVSPLRQQMLERALWLSEHRPGRAYTA